MGRGAGGKGRGKAAATKRITQQRRATFDPSDIFHALNEAGVKYLVVGGVAAILHGVNRLTWDVDLAVQLTTSNLGRLAAALARMGFEKRVPVPVQGLANARTRKVWLEDKGMKVYSFVERHAPQRVVDVMVNPPHPFTRVYRRRVTVRARGADVPLVPVDVLVAMKSAAGRPEDLLDIDALRRLGKVRGG